MRVVADPPVPNVVSWKHLMAFAKIEPVLQVAVDVSEIVCQGTVNCLSVLCWVPHSPIKIQLSKLCFKSFVKLPPSLVVQPKLCARLRFLSFFLLVFILAQFYIWQTYRLANQLRKYHVDLLEQVGPVEIGRRIDKAAKFPCD
jgi:hypothetical protein